MKRAAAILIITTVVIAGFKIKELDAINQERQKLKNLAFCSCLYKSHPTSDFWNNEGSSAGYLETGKFGMDDAEVILGLALEFSKKKYLSKNDKRLDIMKCLDFYNSKALDTTVKKLVQ